MKVDLNSGTGVCETHYGNRRQHVLNHCHNLLKLLNLLSPGLDTKGPQLAKKWNSILIYIMYFIFLIKYLLCFLCLYAYETPEIILYNLKLKKDTKSQSIVAAAWHWAGMKGPLCSSFGDLCTENKHCTNQMSKETLWVTLTNELFCLKL